ncbi:MAG TPA: TAXI family TRAP transporter solute-binding subunit [Vicinamibacterales bacterium]|nr:TAXI family TRAP transporter solute-binding subunit [Vicinamibacterales bacterium]
MTYAKHARLAALGILGLALATPGDTRRQPPAADGSKVLIRLVLDTNFGDALARQYERVMPNVRVELIHVVGSVATVAAIQRGDADMGFVYADVAYFGYLQLAQQRAHAENQVCGIAALEIVPLHLLARAGLHVKTVSDLAGYRVGIGTALSGQSLLASLMFHGYGLDPPIVQADRREDLLAGVDATFASSYYPGPTVTNAMNHGAQLIPIDGPSAAQLEREYPFVRSVTIPAGTYPGQVRDVATIGVDRLLIGSSSLDEALAHDLTRAFIDTLPVMSSSLHTSIRLTNLDQASATPIPLHMGAARYYRERELMR